MDQAFRDEITNDTVGKKVMKVLGMVAASITIAVGLPQLPETFNFLLSMPSK